MSFLYFCCIEALLTYLLRTNKTAIIIASLLINCLLSVFTSHPPITGSLINRIFMLLILLLFR